MAKTPSVGITLKTGAAYTAGDVLGGLLTFDVHIASGSGVLNRLRIVDVDQVKAPGTLHLFDDAPTVITDDAAYATSITAADLLNEIMQVAVVGGDYKDTGAIGSSAFLWFEWVAYIAGTGNLFAYFVCSGTPTFTTATALQFSLHAIDE